MKAFKNKQMIDKSVVKRRKNKTYYFYFILLSNLIKPG